MKLKFNNLSKSYGKKDALKGLSFTLDKGIYGLLGPNGAGKSTLMNLITDNILPSKGEITLDGIKIQEMGASYRERLGYMPQQQALFNQFTAREFLGYMATLKGMRKKDTKSKIDDALEMVNLTDEANSRLGSFSGGMKQRILIAQAILNNPDIIILDEPTAGLDPKERIRIRNLISEIGFNKIVIIATHVVPDIEFISKEILLLKEGNLIAKAPQEELINSMEGKVYEIQIIEEDLHMIMSKYKVSSINKDANIVFARVISDVFPHIKCKLTKPRLEDLYLYLFE